MLAKRSMFSSKEKGNSQLEVEWSHDVDEPLFDKANDFDDGLRGIS